LGHNSRGGGGGLWGGGPHKGAELTKKKSGKGGERTGVTTKKPGKGTNMQNVGGVEQSNGKKCSNSIRA